MKQRITLIITFICVFISGIFFLGTCYLTWKNNQYGHANHWFLFGTEWDRSFGNYNTLAVAGSLPLIIPFLMNRNKLNTVLLILAVPLFIFLKFNFYIFTD